MFFSSLTHWAYFNLRRRFGLVQQNQVAKHSGARKHYSVIIYEYNFLRKLGIGAIHLLQCKPARWCVWHHLMQEQGKISATVFDPIKVQGISHFEQKLWFIKCWWKLFRRWYKSFYIWNFVAMKFAGVASLFHRHKIWALPLIILWGRNLLVTTGKY